MMVCCEAGRFKEKHHMMHHATNNRTQTMNFFYVLIILAFGFALGCLYQLTPQVEILKNCSNVQIHTQQSLNSTSSPPTISSTAEAIIPVESLPTKLGSSVEDSQAARLSALLLEEEMLREKHVLNARETIRRMMRDTWNAYAHNAWGFDSLKPVTNEPDGVKGSGRSILASMSTLWVMGLKEEFEQARKWIKHEMNFGKLNQKMNVFSVVTDYIGGLLSCFALTGDRMFVDKAAEIAQAIQPAYRSETGLPYPTILPRDSPRDIRASYLQDQVSLSHIAQQLEYRYLAHITNDTSEIERRIESIWEFIRSVSKPRGLYMSELSVATGYWTTSRFNLWEDSSEFYFNLLKSFIQTGGTNQEVIQWYREALDALRTNAIFARQSYSLAPRFPRTTQYMLYAREYEFYKNKPKNVQNFVMEFDYMSNDAYGHRLGASSCQLGAMLSLGSSVLKDGNAAHWMEIANDVVIGCNGFVHLTKTELMPAVCDFENGQHDYKYSLSPQLAQSNFILWRLTHKQKYRDSAWRMVMAIFQHCRTENGAYSSIENVNQVPTVKTNSQPPHFLSATLKYLYLTFTNDSVLPLDQWVFNSAGHPLPICGENVAYPKC